MIIYTFTLQILVPGKRIKQFIDPTDTETPAKYIKHAIDGNLHRGMKDGKAVLVANQSIRPGEHLFWDYNVPEETEWKYQTMVCYFWPLPFMLPV